MVDELKPQSFPQFEVLNPAVEIDIARTIASAGNGIHLTVTDTCTSGTARGIYVEATSSGSNAGGTITGVSSSLTVTGDHTYAYPITVSLAKSGTLSGIFAAGISIDMKDFAGEADSYIGLDIGMRASETCGSRHCFIRCREHTAVKTDSAVMRLEGGNSAAYFLIFDNPAGAEDAAVILDAATCNQVADHRIRVHLEHTVVDRYIYLYPI